MEKITDWNQLWRDLVELRAQDRQRRQEAGENQKSNDPWRDRTHKFERGVSERWKEADSSRDFVLAQLDADSTVLDIGAGTGAWSMLMAGKARRVTALDPSGAMLTALRENIAARGIANIDVVSGAWPEAAETGRDPIAPHDFSLCSHAMYSCPDLAAFIRKMQEYTRRMCFLLLRAPSLDSIQAEAARHIWGQPLDSPNFAIAYNVLMQMGIYANVLMENTGFWKARTSPDLATALARLKRLMSLAGSAEHDEFLTGLLRRRLSWQNGAYVWPAEVCSALVYWRP